MRGRSCGEGSGGAGPFVVLGEDLVDRKAEGAGDQLRRGELRRGAALKPADRLSGDASPLGELVLGEPSTEPCES